MCEWAYLLHAPPKKGDSNSGCHIAAISKVNRVEVKKIETPPSQHACLVGHIYLEQEQLMFKHAILCLFTCWTVSFDRPHRMGDLP